MFFKDKSASDMTNLRYVCVDLYSRGLVWSSSFVLVFGGSHPLSLLPSKMRSGGESAPSFCLGKQQDLWQLVLTWSSLSDLSEGSVRQWTSKSAG